MSNLLLAIITSALVATLISELISWLKEKDRLQLTGRQEALLAATQLEGYALDCSHKLAAHTTAEASDGSAGSFIAAIPEFPTIVVAGGLIRPKKASIASRVAEFPQLVRQADQEVEFWRDSLQEIEYARNAVKKHTASIGLECLSLAKQIRRSFGLPERQLVFGEYNIEVHLAAVKKSTNATEQLFSAANSSVIAPARQKL